jgi:hypothetical protein
MEHFVEVFQNFWPFLKKKLLHLPR